MGRMYMCAAWQRGVAAIGVPLDPGATQGGFGAAHKPRKKVRGGIRMSPDPGTNSGRYWGRPRGLEENLWGYGGVP